MGVVDLFNQIADNNFGFFQQVQVVADVMTENPQCVSLDDTFGSVAELLRRGQYHHAPVLNPEDQSIVGIVSDRDLLRQLPRSLGTAAERDDDPNVLQHGVARLMTRSPVWCTRECSLTKAMTLMLDHHVDSVLVSPDGRALEGILTTRDFITTLLLYHRVCTRDDDLRRLRLVDLDLRGGMPLDEIFSRGAQSVRDVMTKTVQCLTDDEKLSTAITRMQDLQIRHLPIVNAEGGLVGLLSDRDILKALPGSHQRSAEPGQRFREALFATDDKTTLRESVQTVMNSDIRSMSPGTLLTDALRIFHAETINAIPVIESETGQLCGIVTTSDILRVFRVVMRLGILANGSLDSDLSRDVQPAGS